MQLHLASQNECLITPKSTDKSNYSPTIESSVSFRNFKIYTDACKMKVIRALRRNIGRNAVGLNGQTNLI